MSDGQGTQQQQGDYSRLSLNELREELRRRDETAQQAHAEAANLRHETKSYKAKIAEIEQREREYERKRFEEEGRYKELTTLAKKELEQTKAQVREWRIEAALTQKAQELGVIDPKLAKLIDARNVRYDERTGEVTGVAEAVSAFKQSSPALFQAAPSTQRTVRSTGSHVDNPPPGKPGTFDVRQLNDKDYQAWLKINVPNYHRS